MSKKGQKKHELKYQARQQLASKFNRATQIKLMGFNVMIPNENGLEELVKKVVK